MSHFPRVAEYMDTVVHTLRPETDIYEAVDFLLAHGVTGAPVVDDEDHLIGIVTAKDCLRLLTHGADDQGAVTGTVADFMTTEVVSIGLRTDIYYAAGIFLAPGNYFRRLPVVKDGKLVGAITRFDILRAIQANFGNTPPSIDGG